MFMSYVRNTQNIKINTSVYLYKIRSGGHILVHNPVPSNINKPRKMDKLFKELLEEKKEKLGARSRWDNGKSPTESPKHYGTTV